MTELYAAFIRHGEYQQKVGVPSAYQPFGLTEKGLEQSRAGAHELKALVQKHDWHWIPEIDCSVLLRAWQTAVEFQKQILPLETVTECEALCERCVGNMANLTVEEIETILREDPRHPTPPQNWKSNSHYKLPYPGAESLLEAGERMAQHIRERMHALSAVIEKDSVKVFVGHGAAFRHAAHHLGGLAFDEIAQLSMFHARPVVLQYNSTGHWKHVAGEWKVRSKKSEFTD